jgi:catechol 2,3-dioxygenase-like lactoylglutathione lyase family enzyme
MRHSLMFIGLCLLCSRPTLAPPARPSILNVLFVRFKVSDFDKAEQFYDQVLMLLRLNRTVTEGVPTSPHRSRGCFVPEAECYLINLVQHLELAANDMHGGSMLDTVGFSTADADGLYAYLMARGLRPERLTSNSASKHFEVLDPEGHRLVFFQSIGNRLFSVFGTSLPISNQIIHVGFVVHDRAAEDHFYKDILGFHVYWHGGMKDGKDDWVDMQVPDGTDWIEYMLNVPADASHKTLGVMNHIALGVPDIHAAAAQLRKNGWTGTEQPQIGRDGKWQLNLYDPDDTRIEFMEFTPVQKPCCSEFAGPHPGLKQ